MIKVNVFEIKARLSEYLDRAARGDRIVIYRHNKPVAELHGVEEGRTEPRPIGPLPGRPVFKIPAPFFEPLSDEELLRWEGAGSELGASIPTKASPTRRIRKRSPRRGKTR